MSIKYHLAFDSPPADPVEHELNKDIWDVRLIPGARYAAQRSDHLLNFATIPLAFRALVKRYLRLLMTRYSYRECGGRLRYIRLFLDFYVTRYPSSCDFRQLSRQDMGAYLLHLETGTDSYGKPNSKIQIWPEDGGPQPQHKYTEDKYIPESVLYQLGQHMHQLPSKYLSIVIILRASGWRIGDVLNLRYDTCLEHTSSGWWLCGDILKTEVENHKVPLSDDIAAIVAAQRDLIRKTFSEEENPERYLFPSSHKERMRFATRRRSS